MPRILVISIAFIFLLSAADCSNNSGSCNEEIAVVNSSEDTVIFALKNILGYTDSCNLSGDIFAPGEIWYYDLYNSCWEDKLYGNKTVKIYVIDPSRYNDPLVYYNCDSITNKNIILSEFEVNLITLQSNNFSLTYP